MKDIKLEDNYGWYMRHRKKVNEEYMKKGEKKIKKENINYEDIEIDSLF